MNENKSNLMEQFTRTMMLLHRHHNHSHRERGPFGSPNRGQGRVLSILKMKPEITQKELGYLLDMRNQSLSELLNKLERAGFVTRTQSETDRRVMDIRLTQSGSEAADKTEEQQQDLDKLFDCLNEEEQKNLSGYLDRLICELEKQTMGEQENFRPELPGMPPMPHGMWGGRGFESGRERGGVPFDREGMGKMREEFFGRSPLKEEEFKSKE